MCFSPQADLVSGVVLSGIGADALRHVRRRHDHWGIAALPLLFGIHQLVESLVWFGLRRDIPDGWVYPATWVYLLFAFVVLPVYLPLAIRALEPPGLRHKLMTGFLTLGGVVSLVLLVAMIHGPVTARLGEHHVAYGANLSAGVLVTVAYVVATCGSALFSGYRRVAIFGVVNLVAVAVLAYLTVDGFASLWCGWAALTSIAIAWHLRQTGPERSVTEVLA